MNNASTRAAAQIILLVLALFTAALAFRPVLPIDETRYLTVAWELFLQHDYSHLTLNFQSYNHKPPLMFFLIDGSWDMFGLSRWAALVPFFFFSLAFIALTQALSVKLFPDHAALHERLPWLALGSAPFLIYGTLVMFDIMLSVFMMGFIYFALAHAERPKLWKCLAAGLMLGLGALTKGPVVGIYTLLPVILLALWEKRAVITRPRFFWIRFIGISFLVGVALLLVWLVDLYFETGTEFFRTLIFTQTIDRINGKMESAHARPFYFYVPLLPVLFVPWLLFPAFWRRIKEVALSARTERGAAFALLMLGGILIVFSLISGKQPHYLVPLLPAALMLTGLCLEKVNLKTIRLVSVVMVCAVIGGQAIAQKLIFPKYDLSRMAQIVKDNPDKDWAFVRKYQGELGFLGQLEHPIASLEFTELEGWFKEHPQGYAIIRHHPEVDVPPYHEVYTMDYRSRAMGIFTLKKHRETLKNLPAPHAHQ